METGIALKVEYWTLQNGVTTLDDFEGVNDFRTELGHDYVAMVHGRPGEAGGLYGLTIELLSSIPLSEIVAWLSGGIAFDLLKSGTKAFVLRPFLAAYERFRRRNSRKIMAIDELRLIFQESIVYISNILDEESIVPNLETILLNLAKGYRSMILPSGEAPYEIYVPVFEDLAADRLIRFRVLLDVDETIRNRTAADYTKLWGLHYDFARTARVFDVQRGLLIDHEFWDRRRYWAEWELHRRRTE